MSGTDAAAGHALQARFRERWDAGDHAGALACARDLAALVPDSAAPFAMAAACCVYLGRHAEAEAFATQALAHDPDQLEALDALSHARYALGRRDEAAPFGRRALELRDRRYGNPPPDAPALEPAPRFDAARPERNAIAFTLYGASSKYCENAILNAEARATVYPGWHCRFYVDDSVPGFALRRLEASGARVLHVAEAHRVLPGTLWRFLACDDPGLDRVLLRDADSVIGAREAGAVAEWLTSGRHFHVLRDYGSHTDLILAGLWGMVRGALPPVAPALHAFAPGYGARWLADQAFVRTWVWPHARRSLLQHDSVFGFLDPRPFPGGTVSDAAHVGVYDSGWRFETACDAPDGATLWWIVAARGPAAGGEICRYASTVHAGRAALHLPTRFRDGVLDGSLEMRFVRDPRPVSE